jgi:hypothetical protein
MPSRDKGREVEHSRTETLSLESAYASAVNQQPWSFVVIKDRVLLTHISDRAKVHMLKSPLAASRRHTITTC